LLSAYPPDTSGISQASAVFGHPLATAAGIPLMTAEDLNAGRASEFHRRRWASQQGFPPAPVYSAAEAGRRLAELSLNHHLAWFDYWLSDYAGHHGEMTPAIELLESLDAVLGGLVAAWQGREDLVVISSDHGNIEDLSQRGHTRNPVPLILLGLADLRRGFAPDATDLTAVAPAVLATIFDRGGTA
jgi:hypothetical protein